MRGGGVTWVMWLIDTCLWGNRVTQQKEMTGKPRLVSCQFVSVQSRWTLSDQCPLIVPNNPHTSQQYPLRNPQRDKTMAAWLVTWSGAVTRSAQARWLNIFITKVLYISLIMSTFIWCDGINAKLLLFFNIIEFYIIEYNLLKHPSPSLTTKNVNYSNIDSTSFACK